MFTCVLLISVRECHCTRHVIRPQLIQRASSYENIHNLYLWLPSYSIFLSANVTSPSYRLHLPPSHSPQARRASSPSRTDPDQERHPPRVLID